MEYTKKITMMTFYYFIFKINLSIEVLLDASQIKRYLKLKTQVKLKIKAKLKEEILKILK